MHFTDFGFEDYGGFRQQTQKGIFYCFYKRLNCYNFREKSIFFHPMTVDDDYDDVKSLRL